jgi:acetyltransferase-like isoleucine patch superfamily enzyme
VTGLGLGNLRRLAKLSWQSPERARRNFARLLAEPLIRSRLRLSGVNVGNGVRFFGLPRVSRFRESAICIGAGSELRSWPRSNVLGLAHPVLLTTLSPSARIEIGERVGLSGVSVCAQVHIHIGDGAVVGADALITDTDHHPLGAVLERHSLLEAPASPVWIGPGAFVGARAIVLKGARIGAHAIVGAGAVVSSEIPEYAIAAGNPARVVGWAKGHDPDGPIQSASETGSNPPKELDHAQT